MTETNPNRRPGVCPVCGAAVPTPEFLAGMWSGAKANGTPAGGGVFEAVCGGCGAALEAYNDVYDDAGNVPVHEPPIPPALMWDVRRAEPSAAADGGRHHGIARLEVAPAGPAAALHRSTSSGED
jgi:hypothetical protein